MGTQLTILVFVASTVITTILLQKASRIACKIYDRLKYGVPKAHQKILKITYLLHWSINCAKEALPTPPPKSSKELTAIFGNYKARYDEFQREMDAITESIMLFTSAWALQIGPGRDPEACRQAAIEIIESIEETLKHYEPLNQKFQVTLLQLNPENSIKTPLIAAKNCIHLAKATITDC